MVLAVAVAIVVFGYVALTSSQSPNAPLEAPPTTSSMSTPASQAALVAQGRRLFSQYRCTVCHTTNGDTAAGPTLKGVAGSKVTLNSGQVVVANTQYLRESILNPDAQIVQGYGPSVMSAATDPFSDQLKQGDTVSALVAYIESLK